MYKIYSHLYTEELLGTQYISATTQDTKIMKTKKDILIFIKIQSIYLSKEDTTQTYLLKKKSNKYVFSESRVLKYTEIMSNIDSTTELCNVHAKVAGGGRSVVWE